MSRTNEARHVTWHKTYKCRLDASVFNNKQRWNNDECRCEWEELIDKVRCDNGFIWNRSICEWERDKLYDVGENLDYEICKCRKRLTDKLVEECSEDINGNEIVSNATLNDHERARKSCTM